MLLDKGWFKSDLQIDTWCWNPDIRNLLLWGSLRATFSANSHSQWFSKGGKRQRDSLIITNTALTHAALHKSVIKRCKWCQLFLGSTSRTTFSTHLLQALSPTDPIMFNNWFTWHNTRTIHAQTACHICSANPQNPPKRFLFYFIFLIKALNNLWWSCITLWVRGTSCSLKISEQWIM